MPEIKMGLGNAPDPIYLYVAESEDEEGNPQPWHMYDHDAKKQIPVKDRALTGIINGLRMKLGPEFKGKRPVKLQIQVDAGGQPYIVQSGVDTTFARGVLLALDLVDDFSKPLTLVVANGGDKVIFGRVHDAESRQRIKVMWDKERKILPLAQKLQQKLGQKPQTMEDIEATASNGNQQGSDIREPEEYRREQPEENLDDIPF